MLGEIFHFLFVQSFLQQIKTRNMGSDFAFENEAYSREQFVLYAYKGKPYSKCPKIL